MITFSLNWLYAVFTFEAGRPVNYQCHRDSKGEFIKGEQPMLGTILLIVLILLLLGAFSGSRRWGYYPSGGLGLVVLIVVVLLITGRI